MENTKLRYCVSRRNIFTKLTWLFLGLAVVFTLMSSWGFWNTGDKYYIYLKVLLPVVSCVLYMMIIRYMGEKGFILSIIPILGGGLYLCIMAAGQENAIHGICVTALCIVVSMLYIMTVFGVIQTKWFLVPAFLLPLLYRVFIEDSELFFGEHSSFNLSSWLPELAVLCMILGMLFIVFAMKRRDFTDKERAIEEILLELEDEPESEETAEDIVREFKGEGKSESADELSAKLPVGEKHE